MSGFWRRDVLLDDRHAVFSACGAYRYVLSRRWGANPLQSFAAFVMLNPSTADAEVDDPTIRRCVGFAKAWGLDALYVVNLYAYRATKPRDLWKAVDPVGPQNDRYLLDLAYNAHLYHMPLVAAWGANARADRVEHVLQLTRRASWTALGVTKDGAPRHPLYLRGDAKPLAWPLGGGSDE